MNAISSLFVGLALLCAAPAHAQDGKWPALNREGMALLQNGEYARGAEVTKSAIVIAEQEMGPDHPEVATSLNNLAAIYVHQGKYAQAVLLYKRSLTIYKKALGVRYALASAGENKFARLAKTAGTDQKTTVLASR
ncbi:tetratricopeptide repeat protein [mine drainage metagenome]|uniref:Tetratricopeptide repeat protein n=1 Tax=mine drainage metagenome TaxID=410659 RepID=A0A1J5RTI5_9ZZZZ